MTEFTVKKMNDLTIIIPHKNQSKLLADQIKFLDDNDYKYIVVRGGTFAENCNVGYKASKTPYVCFLNDDIILKEGLFEELLKEVKRGYIVSPTLMNEGGTRQQTGIGFRMNGDKVRFYSSKEYDCQFPNGACLMIDKAYFPEGELFDETFLNGYEDIDFFLRAKKRGVPMKVSAFEVVHLFRQSRGVNLDHEHHNVEYIFNKNKEYLRGELFE